MHELITLIGGRGLIFAAIGSPGAILGSHLAHGLPEKVLLLAFGALLLVVAALMLRERVSRKSARGSLKAPRTLATALAAGLLVGLLAGFFGVGGGFAIVPALTLALGLEMPIAVATSLLVIFINSATALATKVGMGIVLNWPLVITFAISMTLGSMFGAKLSAKANPTLLRRSFAWLLVVVAIYTVTNAVLKAG